MAVKRQTQISPDTTVSRSSNERKENQWWRSRTAKIMGCAAIAGGIILGSTTDQARDLYDDIGIAPSPSVSSAGAEVLIKANDGLRDYGPAALVLGGLGGAAYFAARRRNPDGRLVAMHDITHQNPRWRRIAFTGAVMGVVASASGLGEAASEGANEPIKAMAEIVNADMDHTPIITNYSNAPFNPSTVDFAKVSQFIKEEGGAAIPFLEGLGRVKNPVSENNPSSAPILALPNAVLEQSLHVSMPEVDSCSDISVLVGDQLEVPVGNTVLVNDRFATVAGTFDKKPGLDRVGVLMSIEQASECLYPDMPMTGAIALGLEDRSLRALENKLSAVEGRQYSARTFNQYQDEYMKFWNHSVKPPQMNLILSTVLLGTAAVAAMQTAEILARRKNIAMLTSQGVDSKHIARAYALTAQQDTLLGLPVSVLSASALTTMYNSSQFGLEAVVNAPAVGAGYIAVAGATALASVAGTRTIRKIDTAAELRGGV